MNEQTSGYGPVATRMIFDNDDVRVWEMDLAPGAVCGLHHHTMDYVLFILSGANVGAQSPGGRKMMPFPVKARATYFVPSGGIQSAHNMGDTRFFEALFVIKRPAKPGREKLGFVGCEAVAGKEPGARHNHDSRQRARPRFRNHACAGRAERRAPMVA